MRAAGARLQRASRQGATVGLPIHLLTHLLTHREHRPMSAFHDLTMTSITGDTVAFSQYEGQVCLVVNLASR
jgi:hypothetical protein